MINATIHDDVSSAASSLMDCENSSTTPLAPDREMVTVRAILTTEPSSDVPQKLAWRDAVPDVRVEA